MGSGCYYVLYEFGGEDSMYVYRIYFRVYMLFTSLTAFYKSMFIFADEHTVFQIVPL